MGLFGTPNVPVDNSGADDGQIPDVEIVRVEPHPSAERMDVWITFRNRSNKQVTIDTIEIFGDSVKLNEPLDPGGSQEVQVWEGEAPTTDDYDSVWLYYEDVHHAYKAEYYAQYSYDSGTERYFLNRFRRQSPPDRL